MRAFSCAARLENCLLLAAGPTEPRPLESTRPLAHRSSAAPHKERLSHRELCVPLFLPGWCCHFLTVPPRRPRRWVTAAQGSSITLSPLPTAPPSPPCLIILSRPAQNLPCINPFLAHTAGAHHRFVRVCVGCVFSISPVTSPQRRSASMPRLAEGEEEKKRSLGQKPHYQGLFWGTQNIANHRYTTLTYPIPHIHPIAHYSHTTPHTTPQIHHTYHNLYHTHTPHCTLQPHCTT